MTTPTPDEQTGARLAEAIAGVTKRRGGHGNPACYMQSAEDALQAIAADPDILREYGIGRLPTRSELMACREVDASTGYPVRVFGDDAVDYLAEAGWAIEDPEPPAPELPSVREQVAANLYTANRHRKVDWSNLEGPSRLGWLNHADLLLKEFDITPKAAEAGRSQ